MKTTPRLKYILRLSWYYFKTYYTNFKKMIFLWGLIGIFISIGLYFDLDKEVITVVVLIFGLISQAFVGLIGMLALIPIVGPILAKVLVLPIYWILNAVGYFISLIAIKKGFGKEVWNTRVATIIFLVGVAFGFILGKLI